jgi:hypothetical protein
MLLVTVLAAAGRRSGLGLLWRATALSLAAVALLLAWIVCPRERATPDTLLAAALVTLAVLLAAGALAGRSKPASASALKPFRAGSESVRASRSGSGAPCPVPGNVGAARAA